MLTIQGHDKVRSSLTKYALLFGVVFIALAFVFHNNFTTLISCYVVTFVLMFIIIVGKRRVNTLKIQAKRLDIYFSGSWKTEIKSFQLAELQGRFLNAKTFLGGKYSILEIAQNGNQICAVETRDGFEEARLKTLFSLLNQIQ